MWLERAIRLAAYASNNGMDSAFPNGIDVPDWKFLSNQSTVRRSPNEA
ncbi:MAG: hypothetical protein ACI915_004584 [Gammaproteobacteria bacterium]|jgi:hypothetical protein